MIIPSNPPLAKSDYNFTGASSKPVKSGSGTSEISDSASESDLNGASRLSEHASEPLLEILDLSEAEETTVYLRDQILNNPDIALAVQANLDPQTVLELLEV